VCAEWCCGRRGAARVELLDQAAHNQQSRVKKSGPNRTCSMPFSKTLAWATPARVGMLIGRMATGANAMGELVKANMICEIEDLAG